MNNALLIYNARLLDENLEGNGAVLAVNGKIQTVFQGENLTRENLQSSAVSIIPAGTELQFFDASGLTLTPSFIDTHVHLRDPGLTHKEDLESGKISKGRYENYVAFYEELKNAKKY